jgi:DNA-binding response OmpR family regulator
MNASPSSPTGWPKLSGSPAGRNLPPRILVVEDDGDIRRLNTEVLQCSGYAVAAAVDGVAAWEALQRDQYDLMITDNSMPKLTGFELLQKMRAARIFLPVIIASGTFPPPESGASPGWQPDAALLKPYSVELLLLTVKNILSADRPTASGAELAALERKENSLQRLAVPPPDGAQVSHRILVVDEDHDLRQMYAEVLGGPDCQVDEAADGAAGWAALQANQYQLLITEYDLPKLTGVELVRKVRAAQLHLPVVMVANRFSAAELTFDPALRLTATLMKPFVVNALVDTVKSVLPAPSFAGPPTTAEWPYR